MADFKVIIPHIKKSEGGFSRAKTDTASQKTAPYTTTAYNANTRKIETANDWHTNKGVTWETFSNNAKLGYVVNQATWEQMPDSVWNLIFKKIYWDKIGGDQIKNQAIANYLADWSWIAYHATAVKNAQQVLNRLFGYKLNTDGVIGTNTINAINSVNATEFLKALKAEQIDFYNQVVKANPAQQANMKGWLNRVNDAYNFSAKYINVIAISAGTILFFL